MLELTAAGLYRNYTCFPFNLIPETSGAKTKAGAKVVLFFENKNRQCYFYILSSLPEYLCVI
jgi:hypothetical protein